jgi:hypothetical protein
MTVIPQARALFCDCARFEHKGVEHALLLQRAHALPSAPVITLLREVYHEVVLATARTGAAAAAGTRRADDDGARGPLRALSRAVAALLGGEPARPRRASTAASALSAAPRCASSADSPRLPARRASNASRAEAAIRRGKSLLRTHLSVMLLTLRGEEDGEEDGAGRC